MPDFQKIDGSKLNDNELIIQSLTFGYNIHKMNRIPIFDILKTVFNIDEDKREFIVSTIIEHKIARYGDNDENDLIMKIEGIKAIQTDNPISYMEKLEADKNKPLIDNSIKVTGSITGSQVGHDSDFGNLDFNHNSISLDPPIAKQQPIVTSNIKSNLSMWDKFVKFTDHKMFSIIIIAILATILGIIKAKMGWMF